MEDARQTDVDAPWVMADGWFRTNLDVDFGDEVSATSVTLPDAERATFAMTTLPATSRIEELVHVQLRGFPVELGQQVFLRKGVGERYMGGSARAETTTPDAPVRITDDTDLSLVCVEPTEW